MTREQAINLFQIGAMLVEVVNSSETVRTEAITQAGNELMDMAEAELGPLYHRPDRQPKMTHA